jgi:hypothetical protein
MTWTLVYLGEVLMPDLYQSEAEVAESVLGQVLEAAVQAARPQPPNGDTTNALPDLVARQARALLPLILQAPEQVRRRWDYTQEPYMMSHGRQALAVLRSRPWLWFRPAGAGRYKSS